MISSITAMITAMYAGLSKYKNLSLPMNREILAIIVTPNEAPNAAIRK